MNPGDAEAINKALISSDEQAFAAAFKAWNPVVELSFDEERVTETIKDFGCVVDAIEEGQFAPPPPEKLKTRLQGTNTLFATRVCRNCDARFACDSYREYALETERGKRGESFRRYFGDFGDELDRESWRTINLEMALTVADLDEFL